MSPFWAVVKKELASVVRDRTIVISLLIQLFIASFSSALLLGMLSLYDSDTIMQVSGSGIKIGMVGESRLSEFIRQRGLTVVPFDSFEEAQAVFFQNGVSAIFVVPEGSAETAQIKLYLPDHEAVSSIIRMVVQEPLKQFENYLREQNGIEVRYEDLKGKPSVSFEFIYSVLLPLLMFFPAFVAGSMTVDSLTEELENNTLHTLLSAPLSLNAMIAAKITSSVIVAILQSAAWLCLLHLNKIAIQNAGWILALALIVAGIASTAAALGAVLLKDRERSQFIYSLSLLAATAISALLNASPITTISRLAVGDAYTNGWNVLVFAAAFAGLSLLLRGVSRRLAL